MTLPLVSVAIPAFNHASFIEQTLSSVCSQTYPELELVVIDDGSTDNTYQIALKFLNSRKSRFRRLLVERVENCGVSKNSNNCIEACQGEWVHLLGSDDLLKPNKIERIQSAIESWNCSNLALVHADVDYIDESGQTIARRREKPLAPEGIEHEAFRWIFPQKHFIFNPSIAINRKFFLDAGGFNPELPLEDLDCWLRLSTQHSFARVPEILASYRKHPGNASRQRLKMLAAQLDTYANFLAKFPGLLSSDEVIDNYQKNIDRLWRRLRLKKPWILPMVIAEKIIFKTKQPSAESYRKLSSILKKSIQ